MKPVHFIPVYIVSFFITGCFSVKTNSRFSYSKVSPAAYAAVLKDSSNIYLIDVRTAGEFKKAHFANAVNFSYLNFHFGRDVDSLDRNKLVLLYCQTCHRSPLAARKMKHMGFRKVIDLKGGFRKRLLPAD
ncbi:MAG: rhodanese-like domain-containing protein [Ferruginibacter sp.]